MRCHVIPRFGLSLSLLLWSVPDLSAQGVHRFGVPKGKLPPRVFGNPTAQEELRIRFPHAAANIVGDDLAVARNQIDRTDANGDGITTQQEWAESGFSTPRHFTYHDLNGDGILTLYEHSIGVAAWRMRNERRSVDRITAENAARKLRQRENQPPSKNLFAEPGNVNPQLAARSRQVDRLAVYLLRIYDIDGDERLDPSETRRQDSSYGSLTVADANGDKSVSAEEIAAWLLRRLPPLSQLPLELQSRDTDADGQVSMPEFLQGSEYVQEQRRNPVDEFQTWDRNGDGWITPRESSRPRDRLWRFENTHANVLKPRASIVSDIHVAEDFPVGKLSVYVNLRKQNDNFTELLLIAPGGERIVLLAGDGWQPWRGGQILDGVTFEDDAPLIGETLTAPPWQKRLQPHSAEGNEGKLASLQGRSARGTWRLIVHNQNARAGLLINWSLSITPLDEAAK